MNDREALLQCADWLEAGASLAMSAASKAQGEFAAKSLRELAALRLASQPPSADAPVVSLKKMRLSDGRTDYFVSIKAGNREVTPHVFREEYKSAYHVALYEWLLNGGTEPDLIAFGPDDWPAVAVSPSADVARMREALLTVKLMIQGEQIEAAIVDVGTMQPLGQVVAAAIDGVREAVKPCIHDNAAPVEGDMRLGKYEERNPDSKTWTASIDVFRQYDYRNAAWHLSAIEFHHKDKNEVIALRNKAFAALAQTEGGKSSDGGVEVRHAETGNMPGSVPGEEVSSAAASLERPTVQGVALEPCAGVTPGPSEPTPAPTKIKCRWPDCEYDTDCMNGCKPAPADDAAVAWAKRLADNWRSRRDSLTGDSVRDSCADELEKVAARYTHPAKAADVDAVARLLTAAKMLLQNSIGCAVNHYGNDFQLSGLPGWLADCERDIKAAEHLGETV